MMNKKHLTLIAMLYAGAGLATARVIEDYNQNYLNPKQQLTEQLTTKEYNTFTDSLQVMCDNAFNEILKIDIFPNKNIPKPKIHPFTLIPNRSLSIENDIFLEPKTIDEYLTGNPKEEEIFLLYNKHQKTKDKKQLAEADIWYILFHEATHSIFNSLGYTKNLPIYPERNESPAIIYGLEKTWERGQRENKPMYKEYVKRIILDYLIVYNQMNKKNIKVQDLCLNINLNEKEIEQMNSFLKKYKNIKIHEKRFNPNIPSSDGFVNGCLKRADNKQDYLNYIGIN